MDPKSLVLVDGDNLTFALRGLGVSRFSFRELTKLLLAAGEPTPRSPRDTEFGLLRFYRSIPLDHNHRQPYPAGSALPVSLRNFTNAMAPFGWTVIWTPATPVHGPGGEFIRSKGYSDLQVGLDAGRVLFSSRHYGVNRLVLVTGDRDFVPLVRIAREECRMHTVVAGTRRNLARHLIEEANETLFLEDHLAQLRMPTRAVP